MSQKTTDKKRLKVAIVSLYSVKNLGARFVHAYLEKQKVDSTLFFFKDININDYQPETDDEINSFIDKLKSDNYDLVGLSIGCSAFADLAKKLTIKLKKETSALVVWGGVHPTILPEKCIDEADVLCVGEGEKPLMELIEKLENGDSYSHIPNLWVNNNGSGVTKNDIRNLPESIDDLPWPKYGDNGKYYLVNNSLQPLDPIKKQDWEYVTMTSRGCPYQCTYCINSFYFALYKGKGKYIRQRSVEHVIEELVYAKKTLKDLKKIAFYDDVFGMNQEWNKKFAKVYKEKIGLPFWCYVHPQSVKKDNLEVLKDAGLYMVDIGLQSGSEQVRKEVLKRGGSNEKFKRVIKIIQDLGIKLFVDVIVDNPYETEEDKKETFWVLLSLRPFNIIMHSLTHFPMTELTNRTFKDGLIKREDIEDVKKNIFYMWRAKPLTKGDTRENIFWKSLILLSTKDFIPAGLLKSLSRQKWLKKSPHLLIPLVYVSNYIKWFGVGIYLMRKGLVSPSMVRQWAKYVLKVGS